MNDIILLIAQAQTLLADTSADSVYVMTANVIMGGLLSILITWLNYKNGIKLKAVATETAGAKNEIRATNEGLGKISLTIDGKLDQLVAAKERAAHAMGRQEGIDFMAVAPDPVATATAVAANTAALALIENAKTTAAALKSASSVLTSPIDTEPARQAAIVLRDTASLAATRLLADVVQKDPTAVALAAAVASDLLATAAQVAAALKAVAVATTLEPTTLEPTTLEPKG